MKSIFEKLSLEEIKELSKEMNKAQAESFGNPLSLSKQEKLIARMFGFKNFNQIIGAKKSNEVPVSKEKLYQTKLEFVVLSEEEPYNYLNLKQLDYDINFGGSVGYLKSETKTNLNSKEMISQLEEAGSDASFFQLDELSSNVVEILDLCFERVQELIDVDEYIEDHLIEFLEKEYEGERSDSIKSMNRANDDSEVSDWELKVVENQIDEDMIKRYVQGWLNEQ